MATFLPWMMPAALLPKQLQTTLPFIKFSAHFIIRYTSEMQARHRLSLFRRIMRLHQLKLPELQRSIGDQYVRQEFRAHREVKPDQEKQFLQQWEEYAAHLTMEADIFGLGRDLADRELETLSDDQKAQLERLKASAISVGVQERTEAGENPYKEK